MSKNLLKTIKEIKENDSFLVTITLVNRKEKSGKDLDTFLFINNFPYTDFEGTKKMIVKLIDEARAKNKK